MNRMILKYSIVFFAFAHSCFGVTYYLSPSGDNTRTTTQAQSASTPWQTLTKAFANVAPGDTVILATGSYAGAIAVTNGTAGNVITVDGQDKSAVITSMITCGKAYYYFKNLKFDYTGQGCNDNQADCSTNPEIDPITGVWRHPGPKSGSCSAGIDMTGSVAHHNTVESCEFGYAVTHSVWMRCASGEAGKNHQGAHDNLLLKCDLHDMWGEFMITGGYNNTVKQCHFYNNAGFDFGHFSGDGHIWTENFFDGLKAHVCDHCDVMQEFAISNGDGATNIIIERNLFKDTTGQCLMTENRSTVAVPLDTIIFRNNIMIRSRHKAPLAMSHWQMYNNTFYNSSNSADGQFGVKPDSANGSNADHPRFYNNLFIRTGTNTQNGFYGFDTVVVDVLADYNMFTNADTGNTAKQIKTVNNEGVTIEAHKINGGYSPYQIFVDPDNDDLRLKSGSPAIGAGTNLSGIGSPAAFSNDYNGSTRSGTWDMGALAAVTASPTPTPTPAAPVFTSGTSATFTRSVSATFTVLVTSQTVATLSKTGALPTGVTFVDNHNNSATLSGASTATGTFPLTLTAVNSTGTTNQSFTLTVVAPLTAPTPPGQIIVKP